MTHATTAELRRLVDDPWAVRESARAHTRSCDRCSRRRRRMESDAATVAGLLPDLSDHEIGTDLAWARFKRDLESGRPAPAAPARRRRPSRRALTIGTVGIVALGATSAAAAGVVTVLTPTQVAPIQLGEADVSALLQALPTATLTQTSTGPSYQVDSLAQAEAETGLTFTLPTQLPSGVSGSPSISVEPAADLTLTFGQGATKRSVGHGSVPAWLVGTTLRINAGPAVLVTYTGGPSSADLPALAVGAAKAPVLTANGATPQSIEDYVLSQPGVSPALAAEVRVLGAPGAVLPVPIPADANVSDATVGGRPAVVMADPSGFASGVIWEHGGTVRIVGGLVSTAQALQVADELG